MVVVAHALHFQFQLFFSHQQVVKLGAILVVVYVNLAVQEVQEAPEVVGKTQRKTKIIEEGKSW